MQKRMMKSAKCDVFRSGRTPKMIYKINLTDNCIEELDEFLCYFPLSFNSYTNSTEQNYLWESVK